MRTGPLLVGGFVLGALALVVAAVLWLGGESLFARPVLAVIHFQGGVAGLSVGAPVTFRGVPVGQVDDIGIVLDPASLQARIPVRVKLQPERVRLAGNGDGARAELSALIERGLQARLVAQSFVTGQKAIDLDFAEGAPRRRVATRDGLPEIPAVADRFEALFDQVAALPLRDTVDELRRTLRELQGTLVATRSTVTRAGEALDTVTGEVTGVARDSRRTLATITGTLEQLRGGAEASLRSTEALLAETRGAVADARPVLQATLEGTRQAAESAGLAMRRLEEVVEPGAPTRADLDAALRDLAQAARGLRDLSELLERQPNALIFGREAP